MDRGLFSPLGTPTPLGSMGYGARLDTPQSEMDEDEQLKQMDHHLRQLEQYEQQKLESSVEVGVIFVVISSKYLLWTKFVFKNTH
jgi:hypothetical protein